jgi:carboxymethylenebutenolidase
MQTSRVDIDAADGGSFFAHVARPEGPGPFPGLVLIQEIFGVNAVMRGLAEFFAKQGFLCFVPDLFWRIEPGIELSDATREEWERAFDCMNRFDQDRGVADIQAAISRLRDFPGCNGKVGTVGYCLGGRMAYFAATRTDVDASVGYYGVGLDGVLGEAGKIGKPLMLHIAGKDKFVPRAAQEAITAGLKDNPQVTLHHYPDQDHAFARMGGEHWDAAAAEAANSRSIAFLRKALG